MPGTATARAAAQQSTPGTARASSRAHRPFARCVGVPAGQSGRRKWTRKEGRAQPTQHSSAEATEAAEAAEAAAEAAARGGGAAAGLSEPMRPAPVLLFADPQHYLARAPSVVAKWCISRGSLCCSLLRRQLTSSRCVPVVHVGGDSERCCSRCPWLSIGRSSSTKGPQSARTATASSPAISSACTTPERSTRPPRLAHRASNSIAREAAGCLTPRSALGRLSRAGTRV